MRPLAITLGLFLSAGCGEAAPDSGQTARLQIKGAQFLPGPIAIADQGQTPEVHSIATLNNALFPGVSNKNLSGTVGPDSTAVLLGLLGDTGHWVLPVQDFDHNRAEDFIFSCSASFNVDPARMVESLVFRAVSKDGRVGPAWLQDMEVTVPQPSGFLVVSLDWDTAADLDLHLEIPAGDGGVDEIWSRKSTGIPRRTLGATVADGIASGYLDHDSNSQCVLDGRQRETIVFPNSAPSGRYVVRVDTFSLCGESSARWRVRVFSNGVETGESRYGQSTESDTRFNHGQGAGVEALVFGLE